MFFGSCLQDVLRAGVMLQVPRSEMQAALALRFGGDGIVKMKGLPFKATADDVIKYVMRSTCLSTLLPQYAPVYGCSR